MGELFAVVSTISFALANVTIVTEYRGSRAEGGAFGSTLLTLVLAAGVWLVLGLRAGFVVPRLEALAWFGFAGILTALVGRVFLFASIHHLGAVRGSAVKRLNPMFAVVLGVWLLGEIVSVQMGFGIALILASFVVLTRESMPSANTAGQSDSAHAASRRIANVGYLHGVVSALAYAAGYVARKTGLLITPDAMLGTFVGAAVGIAVFCLLATRFDHLRRDIVLTFSQFNPWLWLAGLFTSVGQLSFFAALRYTSVSTIALITSMEVFATIFLSRFVLRRYEGLSAKVVVAAALGVVGTLLVIRY